FTTSPYHDLMWSYRAGIAPGKRVKPSESGRSGRSASTSRYARNACGGVRATNWAVAMVSPHAPCFAGPLRGAVVGVRASSAGPLGGGRGGRPGKLGRAIGIDAYARRKGHRYNTLIVDLDSGHPIATFKGRQAEDVIAWFTSRPQAERDLVEVVVLDMSKTFLSAIKAIFGDHVQVIDRFHGVQQAVSALDEVLRSVPKQLDPEEAKALKKLRKRWLKSADQLQVDELI